MLADLICSLRANKSERPQPNGYGEVRQISAAQRPVVPSRRWE